jgi:L-2,4-diaminobutyrate decarboxylase
MNLICPSCSARYFVDEEKVSEKGFRCNVCKHFFPPQKKEESSAPPSANDKVKAAFDPAVFRAQGHRVVDLLADYLANAISAKDMPVSLWLPPEKREKLWPAEFPNTDPDRGIREIVSEVLSQSIHLHHPRFMGHQVSVPLPMATLFDLVISMLNNGMAVYEMGAVMTVIERSLIKWMSSQLGLPDGADGVFTSGGSAGNLTAMLAARQVKSGKDTWTNGDDQKLTVLGSAQSHYSIQRSLQIMGMGRDAFWPVQVDEEHRLLPSKLADAKKNAEANGRKVIAVVGSACSTATGSFDPLNEIADFCQKHKLWFHVDGAHGASLILSKKHRHLLSGVERADSITWDAHKMMMMPSLCTAVIFREASRSYEAFAQEASYLFTNRDPKDEWYNMASRTLECTKRAMGLKLYASLSMYGPSIFEEYIDSMIALAKTFADKIKARSNFELAIEPACNIVCFRFKPQTVVNLDVLQHKIRQQLLTEGSFYIVQTQLSKGLFLRTTLLNPFTTEQDLEALLQAIEQLPS